MYVVIMCVFICSKCEICCLKMCRSKKIGVRATTVLKLRAYALMTLWSFSHASYDPASIRPTTLIILCFLLSPFISAVKFHTTAFTCAVTPAHTHTYIYTQYLFMDATVYCYPVRTCATKGIAFGWWVSCLFSTLCTLGHVQRLVCPCMTSLTQEGAAG